MKILVINGPNINMLGIREPRIYGTLTYSKLEETIKKFAAEKNADLDIVQTNCEGEYITHVQQSMGKYDALIVNPGAFTHYSYAIYDALLAVGQPTVEVHISNIHKREDFRQKSITAPACIGQISGFGHKSYLLAIDYLLGEEPC